jgi:DNA invertase Pin-like site-specific DNA recombinase
MRSAVSYIRVSKPKQGRSGLGLEAQQAAIKTFCAQHGYQIEAEYREVELSATSRHRYRSITSLTRSRNDPSASLST